jgi:hypothetical protein
VLSTLDRVMPELQLRHITFRRGADELYLLAPANSHATWVAVILPGRKDVEVTVCQRDAPADRVRSDGNGVAVFPYVKPGPVRFGFRLPGPACGESGVEVQTEWVLIP